MENILFIKFIDNTYYENYHIDNFDENSDSGKDNNIIKIYFRELRRYPALEKDEEILLARKLKNCRDVIKIILQNMPFLKEMFSNYKDNIADIEEREEFSTKILNTSIEILSKQINDNSNMGIIDKKLAKKIKSQILKTGLNINILRDIKYILKDVIETYNSTREEFIRRNLRLVVSIAKNYLNKGLPINDIIQEGNIGLIKAVDRFQPDKCCRFSTYAKWWISQSILRALQSQSENIRIPSHIMDLYAKISRKNTVLLQTNDGILDHKRLSDELSISEEKIVNIINIVQKTISLTTPISDDGLELEDCISDKNSPSPFDYLAQKETNQQICKILKILSPKEEKVIKMRFGINNHRNFTLEEIGNLLDMTREGVRQLEEKALKKLRHPKRIKEFIVLKENTII